MSLGVSTGKQGYVSLFRKSPTLKVATVPGHQAMEKYHEELKTANFMLEDCEEAFELEDKEDIELAYEKICRILKKLEKSKDGATKRHQEERGKLQSVKLQKYTITPFKGEYKDWLRFWNQFTVEVDGSGRSEISKFNYRLELVTGKPREDILGLPHTRDGYEEAKRMLEQTYGRDIKIHKTLIKELETLPTITSVHKLTETHSFYNQFSRIIRKLVTMKKLETAQSFVYSLMDKLGPVKEAFVQKDDDWEE